ncbi:HAD family hydrolase [Prosthecochloris sp. HL-130-GSB]|jgi:glucose-1-phosphatase|uniref:HAD family hydrolase n=1 Tax=Prosthecochloris sp. HL-130-GSB TaxID=1974213 RepID=UPI000A1C0DE7|nr:HAD family hydrolase [Prosthecochloris sp. HL-130-GSB]ARM31558.1 hypothetical protein B9H02_09935 [Prosthecochloris sp. HL-130-GSB]
MTTVLLDIGNVIVNVDFLRFSSRVARSGSHVQCVHDRFCTGEVKDAFDRGQVSSESFLQYLIDDDCTAELSTEEACLAWQSIFSLVDGAREGVRYLRERYAVWFMSDTDPLHARWLLDQYDLFQGAEGFLFSYRHGALKTESAAFTHALQATGCPPEQLLLIDDKSENGRVCSMSGIGFLDFRSWNDTIARLEQ